MINETKDSYIRSATRLLPLAVLVVCMTAVILAWLTLSATAMGLIIGLVVSLLMGLTVSIWQRSYRQSPSLLETPFLLAHDAVVFDRYQHFSEALRNTSQQRDPIYREIALEHLAELVVRAKRIAGGNFEFEGTETWRIVYERLLRSPGLHLYRSVAWIRHRDYWQDEPGRKSMAANFELNDAERLTIERIAIVADALWPAHEVWPEKRIRYWLHEQHARGIWIKFVRESELRKERELVADMGIYGLRAVGIQELDDECRTMRFRLSFNPEQVAAAEDCWVATPGHPAS